LVQGWWRAAKLIELLAILAFIIAARRLGRAAREPRRLDIRIHIHVDGSPGGPGEREPVCFEYAENPNANVVPFRPRRAALQEKTWQPFGSAPGNPAARQGPRG
jgi:hypothetical protein